MKGIFVFVGVVLALLFFVNFISSAGAQSEEGIPFASEMEKVENAKEKIKNIKGTLDDAQGIKFQYLKEEWTDYVRTSKYLGPIHRFFEKINIVFVVLFARNYEVSIELFFAICLWLATWYGLAGYITFLDKSWQQVLLSLGGTIIIAQTRLFNLVAVALFKIVFYRQSFWWSLASTILVVLAIIGYGKINGMIGEALEAAKKARELEEQKRKVEQHESEWQAMGKKYDNTKNPYSFG